MPETSATGNVIIYTGDGKGKTSAAIGTAVRASGHGYKVLFIFFMKGSGYTHGEVLALKNNPAITFKSFGRSGWVKKGQITDDDIIQARAALSCVRSAIISSDYDFIIMDEVNTALDFGLVNFEELKDIIINRLPDVTLVLTGRNADPQIYELADIVTEMKLVKYRYENGNNARKGLDY